MQWLEITDVNQLDQIDTLSFKGKVLIFKHSTRCGISTTALNRIERNWKEEYQNTLQPYYLDLLNYRPISNVIEQRYSVLHQSPQALIISEGKCIFSQTHSSINLSELLQA